MVIFHMMVIFHTSLFFLSEVWMLFSSLGLQISSWSWFEKNLWFHFNRTTSIIEAHRARGRMPNNVTASPHHVTSYFYLVGKWILSLFGSAALLFFATGLPVRQKTNKKQQMHEPYGASTSLKICTMYGIAWPRNILETIYVTVNMGPQTSPECGLMSQYETCGQKILLPNRRDKLDESDEDGDSSLFSIAWHLHVFVRLDYLP